MWVAAVIVGGRKQIVDGSTMDVLFEKMGAAIRGQRGAKQVRLGGA